MTDSPLFLLGDEAGVELDRAVRAGPLVSEATVSCLSRALALTLFALTACTTDVVDDDAGFDFYEPEDDGDVSQQGIYNCSERRDTGYRSGSSFSITVVTVDGKPVERGTANAYIAMQEAAARAGVSLRIVSGFRTMSEQQYLYGCYVNCSCNNCNLAARPGYSNHQSGHALDLNTSSSGVLNWLNNNGARFGFSRTVPSEPWHWEWWGNASDFAGPCGGDQRCINNPDFGSCNGTVVTRCDETNQVTSGDCGVFGAGCSTGGPDGPHCVHPLCLAELSGRENGAFCKNDRVIGTCEWGEYSEGDCGAFGATCSEEGGNAHCVHFMCTANLGAGQENGSFCVDGTEKIGTCAGGQYTEGDCAVFGATCSEEGGTAHCVHFMCTAELGAGQENGSFCVDDTEKIGTCAGGQYSEGDCAAFGGRCSEQGGGHCVHFMCWSTLDGEEDGSGCFDDDTLVSCARGAPTITECGAAGGVCRADNGGARCTVPGAPTTEEPTPEPTPADPTTEAPANDDGERPANDDGDDADADSDDDAPAPDDDVVDLGPSVNRPSCAAVAIEPPALWLLALAWRRRRRS